MSDRKYKVWSSSNRITNEKIEYFVTDITEDESKREEKLEKVIRPPVARFPISQLYPADEQSRRANMLCDYMNKILDVTNHAIEQTALIDILSASAPTLGGKPTDTP
jgi:hypothetical protein